MRQFFFAFLLLVLSFSAPLKAQNRSIVVVYDNSSSMKGVQCDAVNYALQTLVGVVHPDDELSVVTMTNQKHYVLDLNKKQNQIDQVIKTFNCRGGNPFSAVDKAISQLDKSKKEKKWLLLLTDGEWDDLKVDKNRTRLNQFIKQPDADVQFLNLDILKSADKNTLKRLLEEEHKIQALQTQGKGQQIIDEMGNMAATVMAMPASGITATTKDRLVTIDTKVPLKRLIVIEQEESANLPQVTKAIDASANPLFLKGPFTAKKSTSNINIAGNITHILPNREEEVIPKGKISITFDKVISNEQFKFLPDVAAKLIPNISGPIKGKKGNNYIVCDTAKYINLEAKLLDLQGNALENEVLYTTKVEYIDDDTKQKYALQINKEGVFTHRYPITKDKVSFSVTAKNKDYFNFKSNIFTVTKENCPVPYASLKADQTSIKANLLELDQVKPISIQPLIQIGENPPRPATKEELKDLSIEKLNDTRIGLITEEVNGTLQVRPAPYFCRCFTSIGTDELQIGLVSQNPSIKVAKDAQLTIPVTITRDSFWQQYGICIIALIVGLLLLLYIIGLLKKPRFAKGSEVMLTKISIVKGRPKSYPLPTGFFSRYLIPFVAETTQVGSVTFKAGSRASHILLSAKTQNEDMYISGFPVDSPGKKDLRISNGETLEIDRGKRKEIYEYRKI